MEVEVEVDAWDDGIGSGSGFIIDKTWVGDVGTVIAADAVDAVDAEVEVTEGAEGVEEMEGKSSRFKFLAIMSIGVEIPALAGTWAEIEYLRKKKLIIVSEIDSKKREREYETTYLTLTLQVNKDFNSEFKISKWPSILQRVTPFNLIISPLTPLTSFKATLKAGKGFSLTPALILFLPELVKTTLLETETLKVSAILSKIVKSKYSDAGKEPKFNVNL